ncbi:MAG: sensor histidine kinase [Pseudomonadota bacterium]
MTTTGSIGRRLTLLLAVVAALLSLVSWSMVSSFAREAAERTQDNILAASATIIAEALRGEGGQVRLEIPYAAFSMLGSISQDRVFYRVDAGDDFLTGYPELSRGSFPDVVGDVVFDTVVYRDATLRMATIKRLVTAADGAVPVTVAIAQTRDGIGEIASDLSRTAAALSVAFFVLAVALSAIAAQTSLRPLNEFADAVLRRGPNDLRPLRRRVPSELNPLVASLNRLIHRVAQSINRSEDFIAEAAHRIRTPLTTVRTHAEIALRSASNDDQKERLRQMMKAIDESSRSAGQILDHATVAFRSEDLSQDDIDLADLAMGVAGALEPTADMKEITLNISVEQTPIIGDKVLLESALRNILDNAIKYSPEETTVELKVTRQGQHGEIIITDQGPGLGDLPVSALTERFQRGQNVEGVVGSGLGLTIAQEVATAHNGRLEFHPRAKGTGTCVSLSLPLA